MTTKSPTKDEANEAARDAWIISEIIIALCDSDISGNATAKDGDLACHVRWLAERQHAAFEVIDVAISRLSP